MGESNATTTQQRYAFVICNMYMENNDPELVYILKLFVDPHLIIWLKFHEKLIKVICDFWNSMFDKKSEKIRSYLYVFDLIKYSISFGLGCEIRDFLILIADWLMVI